MVTNRFLMIIRINIKHQIKQHNIRGQSPKNSHKYKHHITPLQLKFMIMPTEHDPHESDVAPGVEEELEDLDPYTHITSYSVPFIIKINDCVDDVEDEEE